MLSFAKIYLLLFGVLTIAGGIVGYTSKGSVASIVAGSISGLLLLLAGYLIGANPTAGLVLGLVVSLLLGGRFAPIFFSKGTMMPAGLMTILSALGIVITALAFWRK